MILRPPSAAAPGSLVRAGAAIALAVLLASGVSACSSQQNASSGEVAAVYEHAVGLSPQEQADERERDLAVLDWAVELGLAEPFSREQLEQLEASDFGARDASQWNRYRDHIERQSQLIRDHLRDALSFDDVREYYREHRDEFAAQDEMTIEIIEWERQRAVATYTIEIDALSVRSLQERDDRVISAALELAEGEQVSVNRDDGSIAQVRCLNRTDAGVEPLDDVVQAASAQLAARLFEKELSRRTSTL